MGVEFRKKKDRAAFSYPFIFTGIEVKLGLFLLFSDKSNEERFLI